MSLRKLVRNLFLTAAITAGTIFGSNNLQAQAQNDTIWGDGLFWAEDDDGTPMSNQDILCTPLQMQGDTIPDTTYIFTTNNGGQVLFDLPVYIDLETGINKHNTIDAIVAPNPSSDFTFAFHGKPTSDINIYAMNGQLVKSVKVNYDASRNLSTAHIDINNHATGIYTFGATTEDGKVGGKVVKTNTPPVGDLSGNLPDPKKPTKNSNMWNATYSIEMFVGGYYDFYEEIIIQDGSNGLISFILEEPPGIPQYQYIGGTVTTMAGAPIQGATVYVEEQGTNTLLEELVTGSDGKYQTSLPLDVGTDFLLSVGGIPERFVFEGDPRSVPNTISTFDDTLKTIFHYVLPTKVRQVPGEAPGVTVEPTADQITEMLGGAQIEYSIRGEILWNQSTYTWNENQKEVNRELLDQGEAMFGLEDEAFLEVDYLLNQVAFNTYDPYTNFFPGEIGVNVAPGGDATQPYSGTVAAPLGNSFSVTPASEVQISGMETSFYKEFFGRAFYFAEVGSRPSFMNNTATLPTNLDRAIVYLINNHYKLVFDENNPRAHSNLENLKNDFTGKNYNNKEEKESKSIVPEKKEAITIKNNL